MAENPYQSILAGIESGSQWAMRAHQLKIQKEEAERAAETHKLTQMAAKFKIGETAFEKLKYMSILENGPEKDTHIKMFSDTMAGIGYPVHPATLAAMKDKNRRQDFLNAIAMINSLDENERTKALVGIVDLLPREDGMSLIKTAYEKRMQMELEKAKLGARLSLDQTKELSKYLVDDLDQRALRGEMGADMQREAAIKAARIRAQQNTEGHQAKIDNIGSQVQARDRNATTAEKRADTQQQNVDSLKGVREKQKADIDSKIGLRSKQGEDIDSKIDDRKAQREYRKSYLELQRQKMEQDKVKTTESLIRDLKNDNNKLESKYEPMFTAQDTVYEFSQKEGALTDALLMGRYQTLREGMQSVLRESEVKDLKAAGSLLTRLDNFFSGLQTGQRLNAEQKKELREIALHSRKITEEAARNALTPIYTRSQNRGLNEKEIFTPRFQKIMRNGQKIPTVYPKPQAAAPAAQAEAYGPPAPNPRLETAKKFLDLNQNSPAAIAELRKKLTPAELNALGIQ